MKELFLCYVHTYIDFTYKVIYLHYFKNIYILAFRVTELENMGHLGRGVDRRHIQNMVEKLAYSDWLILYYLAQVRFLQIHTRTKKSAQIPSNYNLT